MYKALAVALLAVAAIPVAHGSFAAVPTSGSTFPSVVAKLSLANQTTTIPTTTIFTPTQTGLYRVSPYMASMNGLYTCCWELDLGWTDEGGSKKSCIMTLGDVTSNTFGVSCSSGDTAGPFTFRSLAGQPVTFDVTQSPQNNPTYQVEFVIERLN